MQMCIDSWKEKYLGYALEYLKINKETEGGALCKYCRECGLEDPYHHNVWGSMLPELEKLGWVKKIGMIKPSTQHSHIGVVCLWESLVYNKEAITPPKQYSLSLNIED